MSDRQTAIVDGANVAYEEQTADGQPKMSNIVAMREALLKRGFEPIVIIDAALHHEIDDPPQLEAYLDDKTIRQAPADTDADYFILQLADEYDAPVISNDQYESFQDDYPWIEDRRVPFMIVKGQVELYGPALGDVE